MNRILLDSGILLRLLNRQSSDHAVVRAAVKIAKHRRVECVATLQNACEFWNVCTRPAQARGGLGLTIVETQRRMTTLERIITFLPDSPLTFGRWKELITTHQVVGVQVHDTRLVALMDVSDVTSILTLNPSDFARFTHIKVFTPATAGAI